jgi:hypothetical protein
VGWPQELSRYQCDEEGGYTHAKKRGDERRLAADAIAVMAENRSANRPSDKPDEIGAECSECAR